MYLAHIMVLNAVYALVNRRIDSAAIKLPVIALVTFTSTYILVKALSYLPKSKWVVG
jgi:surface polysaccharide O-acyltransferase-like enzyme